MTIVILMKVILNLYKKQKFIQKAYKNVDERAVSGSRFWVQISVLAQCLTYRVS